MIKFGRRYRLTIDVGDGEAIVITDPLTLEFTVNRSVAASVNGGEFAIYNLSKEIRDRVFADRFIQSFFRRITLEAGYSELSVVFSGNITDAFSTRRGNDVVTSIKARDGGFDSYNARTSRTLSAGVTKKEVIENLIQDFTHVTKGKLGDIRGTFTRPVVLEGNTFGLIKKYTNDQVFIDSEKVNVLEEEEVIIGSIPLLTSATGLLETPQRHEAFLTVNTLFEPGISMGQVVEIDSDIESRFDGQFKVLGVKHTGTISGALGGTCTSSFNLMVGTQLFGTYKVVE